MSRKQGTVLLLLAVVLKKFTFRFVLLNFFILTFCVRLLIVFRNFVPRMLHFSTAIVYLPIKLLELLIVRYSSSFSVYSLNILVRNNTPFTTFMSCKFQALKGFCLITKERVLRLPCLYSRLITNDYNNNNFCSDN